MKKTIIGLALLLSTNVFAAATRTIDAAQITNGAATITLPSTTGTLCGKDETCTLTGKTLTSPVINTPTGIVKGDVGLGNVDNTSDATKNAASVTLTNKTITAPVFSGTATGTYTLGGTPSIAASALTGQLGVANGGTGASTLTSGSVVVGNGTSAVNLVAPGTSGNVLTSNGSTWTSAAAPATSPTITGSQASPTAITAAGGVGFSGTNYFNTNYITGSGGAVTVTANPKIAAATSVGQRLRLIGTSATNTVTISDGNGVSLNGTWVASDNSAIELDWNGSVWTEVSRR